MPSKSPGRRVTQAVGWAFIALAAVILVVAWQATPLGAAVAALLVGGLGVDAVLSAARDRPSLLSRIGPLP